ncbi:MAG: SMP-30/gluconolactonase/LRE family protein [Myxococcota bacterium]
MTPSLDETRADARGPAALAPRALVAAPIFFGEGPRWHDGAFRFSDIGAGAVFRVSSSGALEKVVDIPGRPSGLGWLPDGRLLVVSMHDRRLMRFDSSGLAVLADLSPWCGGDANDMVVDAHGRAYVGNIGFDLERQPIEPRPTVLVRVDPDGSARAVASDLMAPNGMAITPDGRTLIVGESGAGCLTAFDVDAAGDLSNRRVYAPLEPGGAPDGLCLDAEGAVWVASPTTRAFLRIREGGEITDRLPTGDRHAIACMLGGTDRRTLYLITAPTMSIRTSIPLHDGRIESVRVAVAGAGRP